MKKLLEIFRKLFQYPCDVCKMHVMVPVQIDTFLVCEDCHGHLCENERVLGKGAEEAK